MCNHTNATYDEPAAVTLSAALRVLQHQPWQACAQ